MYDIFYVSASNGNDNDWKTIKSRYPLAQKLTNIKSYEEIQSKSFTKMFWVIWDDLDLTSFNLLDYKVTKWDDMYVHVFKNGEYYDGVCLFSKKAIVSTKEFSYRFFTDKKEIDIQAMRLFVTRKVTNLRELSIHLTNLSHVERGYGLKLT